MQERRSNAERTLETRSALLAAARAQFLEKGYAATGTPEIARLAGVTRGALYHHFADKQALFKAVVEAEAAAVAAEINKEALGARSVVEALSRGARAYFVAMRKAGRARLMLLEGPAVLGAAEMRRIDLATGGDELRQGIAAALGDSATRAEIDARAELVSAMFDRAALACEAGGDSEVYEEAITDLLTHLAGAPERLSGAKR